MLLEVHERPELTLGLRGLDLLPSRQVPQMDRPLIRIGDQQTLPILCHAQRVGISRERAEGQSDLCFGGIPDSDRMVRAARHEDITTRHELHRQNGVWMFQNAGQFLTVTMSHWLTVLSPLAEKSLCPSSEKARAAIRREWASSFARSSPVAGFHSFTCPLVSPVATS